MLNEFELEFAVDMAIEKSTEEKGERCLVRKHLEKEVEKLGGDRKDVHQGLLIGLEKITGNLVQALHEAEKNEPIVS